MHRLMIALAGLGVIAASPAPALYQQTGSIAGPDGGWDYASIDPATRRLFVAHGDTVTMIDLAHGNTLRSFGAIEPGTFGGAGTRHRHAGGDKRQGLDRAPVRHPQRRAARLDRG